MSPREEKDFDALFERMEAEEDRRGVVQWVTLAFEAVGLGRRDLAEYRLSQAAVAARLCLQGMPGALEVRR